MEYKLVDHLMKDTEKITIDIIQENTKRPISVCRGDTFYDIFKEYLPSQNIIHGGRFIYYNGRFSSPDVNQVVVCDHCKAERGNGIFSLPKQPNIPVFFVELDTSSTKTLSVHVFGIFDHCIVYVQDRAEMDTTKVTGCPSVLTTEISPKPAHGVNNAILESHESSELHRKRRPAYHKVVHQCYSESKEEQRLEGKEEKASIEHIELEQPAPVQGHSPLPPVKEPQKKST